MSSVVFLQLVGNKPELKILSIYVQLERKTKNSVQVFLHATKKFCNANLFQPDNQKYSKRFLLENQRILYSDISI